MKFAAENKGLYYVTYNEKMRSNAVYVYDFDKKEEKKIFEENDEQFYVDISVTKDKKFMVISSSPNQIAEVFVVRREIINGVINDNLQLLFSRSNKSRFFCNHAENDFYVLTDKDGAYDYKIMKISDQAFQRSKEPKMVEFYVPPEGERVKEIDLFKENIVLYLDKEGVSVITIIDLKDGSNYNVQLDEKIADISPGLNENYSSSTFRFHVDTPLVYNRIYEYNLLSKKLILLEDFKILGPKIDQSSFISERLQVPSKDGELIPLTLLMHKKTKKNRKNKLLLHGYGCYGVSLDIGFNVVNIAALENGWILAFAHVRGGNEKGWKWHRSACGLNKIKSFNDFINCAEYLISQKYTHPGLLCAYGASAGGLLVATVMNMRPDLFKAVVMNVPFLDILNTLCEFEI
jgi:oligopeptidase B